MLRLVLGCGIAFLSAAVLADAGRTVACVEAVPPVTGGCRTFDHPWKCAHRALVLDPFFDNELDLGTVARKEKRVVAIIHKSTIGTDRIDPKYFERRDQARQLGLLWGSYHWGTKTGSPAAQADHYLDAVQPGDDELIALDLETSSPDAGDDLMDAAGALEFAQRILERTGRLPVLYTNHDSTVKLTEAALGQESLFSRMPLWYTRYKGKVKDFPTGLWSTYTLWQFSDGVHQSRRVKGASKDTDVDVYAGTVAELRQRWPLTRRCGPSS